MVTKPVAIAAPKGRYFEASVGAGAAAPTSTRRGNRRRVGKKRLGCSRSERRRWAPFTFSCSSFLALSLLVARSAVSAVAKKILKKKRNPKNITLNQSDSSNYFSPLVETKKPFKMTLS